MCSHHSLAGGAFSQTSVLFGGICR